VHPWIPWEIHTSPHDLPGYDEPIFPVAETEIGVIGAAICYDWQFPEAIRQLALAGAQILVRVSAYMDPWGTSAPLDWWTTINRARAVENLAYVVACNQACSLASYPPFSWPGGSMIVDFDGRILTQANPGSGEQIVIGPIDVAALEHERQRRRGHHMLAHLRNELYTGYQQPIYPAGAAAEGVSTQRNEDSIRRGRQALQSLAGRNATRPSNGAD
jgi:predicted amidohydrolase